MPHSNVFFFIHFFLPFSSLLFSQTEEHVSSPLYISLRFRKILLGRGRVSWAVPTGAAGSATPEFARWSTARKASAIQPCASQVTVQGDALYTIVVRVDRHGKSYVSDYFLPFPMANAGVRRSGDQTFDKPFSRTGVLKNFFDGF